MPDLNTVEELIPWCSQDTFAGRNLRLALKDPYYFVIGVEAFISKQYGFNLPLLQCMS